jgi:GWxTD domain-containing protein
MGRVILASLLFLFLTDMGIRAYQDVDQLKQEEAEDHFSKWLNEDVLFIIAREERAVFESLTTPEEKEQFIEQFWFRRDPDPLTAENEFKDEHYRRIAYANERFTSGYPGWKTDRGRVYILHGPPYEIESHASGGPYNRPINEGGGTTSTYPFEIWRYRTIEGVGEDIELEFVDRSMSGEYRLALLPEDKDALLYVTGGGLTLSEEMGITQKSDRSYFSGRRNADPIALTTARDNPFYRYEIYTQVQGPKPVKYKDLKELVQVNVKFSNLPFQIRQDYFRITGDQVLVPITVQVENQNLSYQEEAGLQVARIAIYGILTSFQNRIVDEFDSDLLSSYPAEQLTMGLTKSSVYQKMLMLDRRQRYKLDLVVKDLNSGEVGVMRKGIILPGIGSDSLAVSSVILADRIEPLDEVPDINEMFVIGDLKVVPNMAKTFSRGKPLGLYFQIYNAKIDQSSLQPALRIAYKLLKDGKLFKQTTDQQGDSIQYFSDDRVVVTKLLSVDALPAGPYRIMVEIADQLSGERVEFVQAFTVSLDREG